MRAPALVAEVERAFEYYLDGRYFNIEGNAPLDYEAELLSAILQHVNTETIEPAVAIAEDDDQVTFTVKAIATVGFEAQFSFYAHDSIDGNDIGFGSRPSYVERPLPFEITISVSREIDYGKFDILDVNVTSPRSEVDFGHIDPFPDEDPTHEKY